MLFDTRPFRKVIARYLVDHDLRPEPGFDVNRRGPLLGAGHRAALRVQNHLIARRVPGIKATGRLDPNFRSYLIPPPTMQERIVADLCRWADMGLVEHPAGSNKVPFLMDLGKKAGVAPYYYNMGYFWCMYAVMLAAYRQGSLTAKAGFGGRWNVLYTVALRDAALKNEWGARSVHQSQVKKGTICLLNFPGGQVVDHVEVARSRIILGTLLTVGGNTSPEGGSGSQANGGGVFKRIRRASTFETFVEIT